MDRFLKFKEEDRLAAFRKAEEDIALSQSMIEKDFWVCWALKELFEIKELKDNLTFKGGTSLSKVYNAIKRFSEDIDLSIEKSYFGFVDDKDPTNVSGKKAQVLIDELSVACREYVQNKLLPQLQNNFEKKFGESATWKLQIDTDDNDGQTILFFYPQTTQKTSGYVRPAVKIELGSRAEHWPVSTQKISPYVAQILPDAMKNMSTDARVLNVERTFWEKATILHAFAHFPAGKTVSERQSRHYYDFYCLVKSAHKDKALAEIELLEKVSKHKALYFKSAWANYSTAKKGTLKIIPEQVVLEVMEKDYLAMNEMFFEEPPKWSEIVEALKVFEKEFNN